MFRLMLVISFLLFTTLSYTIESKCSMGCDLALGSYYVWPECNLTFISQVTNTAISDIISYNPQTTNQDSLQQVRRVNVPFRCDCINGYYLGHFLGHVFNYTAKSGDTYDRIARKYYSNLTTSTWVENSNGFGASATLAEYSVLNVPVNCSCGDELVSKDYGLFITYPLRPNESLNSVAALTNISVDLLQKYNPDTNVSSGGTIVYIPGKDKDGNYPPYKSSSGNMAFLFHSVHSAWHFRKNYPITN